MGIGLNRSLNMFTLIALRDGRRVRVQSGGHPRPAAAAPWKRARRCARLLRAAAVIVTLVLLDRCSTARPSRTRSALKALLGLAPKTARRVNRGQEQDVPLASVQPGRAARQAGEKIPVDGVVIEGRSTSTSRCLRENRCRSRKSPAAGHRRDLEWTGSFLMRAERVGEATLLAQIVRMVVRPTQSRTDPAARRPGRGVVCTIVIGVAVVTFAVWLFVGPEPRFAHALVNAVPVLIIACPCDWVWPLR